MFDTIRNHKKYLMGFLLILIIPSFILFGVQGFNDADQRGAVVATVDGQEITQLEWDQAHQTESQRLREAMPTLDAKLLDSEDARYATLERLVRQRVLAVAAQKFNLFTSDQRLARDLQNNEVIASLRRPDGTLDVDAYRQLLGRQGMTPEMFEAQVRADLSQRQVAQGIQSSGFATEGLAKVSLDAFFEQREVRLARFTASELAAQVSLTDADMETFYNNNPALFQSQEQADVEYLVLDAAALQKSIALAEADVRAYYDQNAVRLSGNEERRASHILLTLAPDASAADKAVVREKAAALLAQVKAAPHTFAEVAKANSQDPGSAINGGDLDFFARGAMVKAFEDATFALQKGAISELVESEFGFHIIQLTDIKTPPQRSFGEMRAEIEAELKKQQAQKQFADSAEAFSNLVYEQGDNLTAAAERFKLEIQTARGLTRKPQASAGVLANERLLNAIFAADSIDKKRNTEAIETASGQLVSARIIQYAPARTQPLAEVRDQVRQRLVAQRSADLARTTGAKQLDAWKSGADAAGLSAALVVSRDNAQGLSGPVLNAALSADPKQLPAWVGVDLGEQGYAVVKVDKVLPRQPRDGQAKMQEVQQYSQWWSSAESSAYYDTLKERFKVRIKVPAPKPVVAPAR
ncbi:MAG: SurA N-terminal domain-containing protein [Hydrogenophaga sp.]|uniref:SurA N-terminal domain-containing protein n=1 Tax=Hydrogenophaga sp. TaxID=1904254 RepID=UPI00271E83DC|nr:SurA N-terminal domain-containing protein [Hydrogenophaga sp.]MDO9483292.1 SurA N-terminal domain-containing protein [Hydrogenophaga sp.]MDP3344980.1 SurA N-terminal domain-containing protein [Hydrogenophaga sp.]MDP3805453.1 SurA N-terminal domain-containing protein [Hydrogenophaga sp.]MDZ4239110.1 SurA N-terminal domain-containing protein [Hydrogenophaga sp.]